MILKINIFLFLFLTFLQDLEFLENLEEMFPWYYKHEMYARDSTVVKNDKTRFYTDMKHNNAYYQTIPKILLVNSIT